MIKRREEKDTTRVHISNIPKYVHDEVKEFCQARGVVLSRWVTQALIQMMKVARHNEQAKRRLLAKRESRLRRMHEELYGDRGEDDVIDVVSGPPFWER